MIAWILGIGAMVSLFVSHQSKSRKGILLGKLSADLFWSAHYICLGAIAGMIPNFVGIFREAVFINQSKYEIFSKTFWPILFIGTNLTLGVFSFHNWFDVLPIVASAFVTLSLWIKNPILTKCISVPVSIAFLAYDIFVGSYMGMINESVSIMSLIIFFMKGKRKNETDGFQERSADE